MTLFKSTGSNMRIDSVRYTDEKERYHVVDSFDSVWADMGSKLGAKKRLAKILVQMGVRNTEIIAV